MNFLSIHNANIPAEHVTYPTAENSKFLLECIVLIKNMMERQEDKLANLN